MELNRSTNDTFTFLGIPTLTEEALKKIGITIEKEEFERGECLIKQGDTPQKLMILREGEVEIFLEVMPSVPEAPRPRRARKNNNIRKIMLGKRVAGECIGEMALIQNQTRSASVIAESKCHVFSITQADFEKLVEQFPAEIHEKLSLILSNRLREVSLLTALHLWKTPDRIMFMILYLSNSEKVLNNFSRRELSKKMGISRKPVADWVKFLEESHYIQIKGSELKILKALPFSGQAQDFLNLLQATEPRFTQHFMS